MRHRLASTSQAGLRGAILIAALAVGCADRTPARIDFTAPPSPVIDLSLHPLTATLANAKGEALKGSVSWSAGPADVVEISSTGTLRCLKTGDGTLTLAGGGLTTPVPVKCRIPTEIVMPHELQLILGSAPTALHARALGEGGRPLPEVPLQTTSSDPSVVEVQGDTAKPIAVGKAMVKAAAGPIGAVTPVEVVDRVVSERLELKDGAKRTWNLKRGAYRVEVDVKPSVQVSQGVTLSWAGATCENQPERQSQRASCWVDDAATLTVENPRGYGVGVSLSGSVAVYRVPPP